MSAPTDWLTTNRQTLHEAVAHVRRQLQAHAERGASPVSPRPADPAPRPAPDSALGLVRDIFGLTPFETDVLALCAAVELDASVSLLCAAASGDPSRVEPTFSLALAALADGHWSALTPDAPLRRWQLISLGAPHAAGAWLTRAPLRVDERLLHFLVGLDSPDPQLAGRLTRAPVVTGVLPGSHEVVAQQVSALWSDSGLIVQLCGDKASATDVAARAAALSGRAPRLLEAESMPADPADRDALLTLVNRDGLLGGGALIVLFGEDVDTAHYSWVSQLRGPVAVVTRARWQLQGSLALDVIPLTADEQCALWADVLDADLTADLPALVNQFSLKPAAIRSAANEAVLTKIGTWAAARSHARQGLDSLAARIDTRAGWDDLVVPEETATLLHQIHAQVRHRGTVFGKWGLADTGSLRGQGVSALFTGPSGTGKSLAAEVIARALDLDLYRVDLSQMVSKYIGETEKNLRQVFDAADGGGCALLFDEADALFGKRSEVKDSHDRNANLEVSYLLQRMEAYRGLAVLTTNFRENLDRAFLRRLQFVVSFPLPEQGERERMWRRMLPPGLPTQDLRPQALARLAVPGGVIRNIVLGAAFLAADAGSPLRMTHLLAATHRECTKLERPLSPDEVSDWV